MIKNQREKISPAFDFTRFVFFAIGFSLFAFSQDFNQQPTFRVTDPDPGWSNQIDQVFEDLSIYAGSLPIGSPERLLLEDHMDKINGHFIDPSDQQGRYEFFGEISKLGIGYGITREYQGTPLNDHFLFIVHAHFDYGQLLPAWLGINEVSFNTPEERVLLMSPSNFSDDSDSESEEKIQWFQWNFAKFQSDISVENDPTPGWLDRTPKYLLVSTGGGHAIRYEAPQVTVVGGQWVSCVAKAIEDLIELEDGVNHDVTTPLKINLPAKAIATRDYRTLKDEFILIEEDPAKDLWDFLDKVSQFIQPDFPYFLGQRDAVAVLSTINDGPVLEKRGGDPKTAQRVITLNYQIENINPIALPDLVITDFYANNKKTKFGFSVQNIGGLRLKDPVAVFYQVIDPDRNTVIDEGIIPNFLGEIGETGTHTVEIYQEMFPPSRLTLIIDPYGDYIEGNVNNNQLTISTTW
jgi:hypothetical protein